MKMKKIFAIKYTILFLSLLLIICCSSTKPNTPYSGSYPSEYHELAERNPLLAKELAKLPEINNGISNTEKQAIINIAVLYNKDPFAFDKAFGQMYQIGIPDLRKYCSPLQAFYWLFEDDKTVYINDMIKEYSLKRLLNYSWDFDRLNSGVFLDFPDQMIRAQILSSPGEQVIATENNG
jgi:hypothetical protein